MAAKTRAPESRSCNHPEFRYCTKGAAPFVFVFERDRYISLEGAALDDYRRRRATVESLGGQMLTNEWNGGGERPVFTRGDVNGMKAAVLRDNPDLRLLPHWNGAGCYTASIAATVR